MNLTKNFTLGELVASQVATRKGIDNAPAPDVLVNLTRLAALLEQVRQLVGAPITISSGYRSPALNKAVGGAGSSAHLTGLAADISTAKLAPKALAMLIRQSGIVFDQLIYEGTWVHIALSAGAPRRQVLTAKFAGGAVSYVAGIV
ncbi:D-Ala-D-Ala carboxypeptidase family metallohydrolase [Janthinobacterium sp. HLX7-2]|uniref:D-Ala-D-Ala carboxypeptidase family metallohydrolase n=1 Tax=Janthinobacterium sp. HLX7-2 TaxID=1259331 RepID=UPI003F245D48